jgi:peptidoglycan hydrolase-like protein with peptidoglycan-binding domain
MRVPLTGSTRTIWIMAATAVVSLGAGLVLSRIIVSPSEAAANAAPPDAGAITVPVERRVLANDVVMRGDGLYEDPIQVTVETGDIGGPAVVTGQVPEEGATIDAGSVILEITGRPVILLPGDLPVYRTLRAGVSGPDVEQLKAALNALGINPGNGSNTYDAATAAAVRELYARIGYPPPTAGEAAEAALEGAREMVRMADEQVAAAQRELNAAAAGIPASERIRLDGAVTFAQLQMQERDVYCSTAPPGDPDCTASAKAQLKTEFDAAVATRNEALAAVSTSAQRAALTAAQRARSDAAEDLAKAQLEVLTPMPASEVVYLPTTPRRVDAISVRRGSTVSGAVMSVSGATLQIAGNVAASDADLIAEGSPVTITLPDGEDVTGTVQSVGEQLETPGGAAPDPNRKRVVVVPDELTEDQRMMLQWSNVRVRIPVSSTDGEVLAVPIAALTAGPGGESRVEVLEADGESRLVTVRLGLAAGGFVEVEGIDGPLKEGDRVVVGLAAQQQPATEEDDEEPEPEPAPEPDPDEGAAG